MALLVCASLSLILASRTKIHASNGSLLLFRLHFSACLHVSDACCADRVNDEVDNLQLAGTWERLLLSGQAGVRVRTATC